MRDVQEERLHELFDRSLLQEDEYEALLSLVTAGDDLVLGAFVAFEMNSDEHDLVDTLLRILNKRAMQKYDEVVSAQSSPMARQGGAHSPTAKAAARRAEHVRNLSTSWDYAEDAVSVGDVDDADAGAGAGAGAGAAGGVVDAERLAGSKQRTAEQEDDIVTGAVFQELAADQRVSPEVLAMLGNLIAAEEPTVMAAVDTYLSDGAWDEFVETALLVADFYQHQVNEQIEQLARREEQEEDQQEDDEQQQERHATGGALRKTDSSGYLETDSWEHLDMVLGILPFGDVMSPAEIDTLRALGRRGDHRLMAAFQTYQKTSDWETFKKASIDLVSEAMMRSSPARQVRTDSDSNSGGGDDDDDDDDSTEDGQSVQRRKFLAHRDMFNDALAALRDTDTVDETQAALLQQRFMEGDDVILAAFDAHTADDDAAEFADTLIVFAQLLTQQNEREQRQQTAEEARRRKASARAQKRESSTLYFNTGPTDTPQRHGRRLR
eukprot:TRINITY_DN66890_c5_g1_i2.p1 TRINITY_DN66890_c5_g1~~TRINITY_DN66890_c5_g1_i2.p1  ORF type:complete len:576 (+),score=348.45 TRINITY_DN66890_c5_g1_i2:249-1730(+)